MLSTPVFLGFPCGSAGKESACSAGELGSIPGFGRSTGEGKGYPIQYSGLENSMDSPWGHKELDTTEWLSLSAWVDSHMSHCIEYVLGKVGKKKWLNKFGSRGWVAAVNKAQWKRQPQASSTFQTPETYFASRKEGSLSRLWCHLVAICWITTGFCLLFILSEWVFWSFNILKTRILHLQSLLEFAW